MSVSFDFTAKTALVTGATRGIGRAIAEAFLQAGATVIGLYGSDVAAAEAMWKEKKEDQERLDLRQCDVADEAQVYELFEQVEAKYDTLDILVANAGIRRDAVVAMMKSEDWQRVIDVNLTGTFLVAKQAVLLMMKKKVGRIVFITSPMAHMGFAGQANYAASKAGQIALMRSLSKETAKRRITVNCISPGFIETDLIQDLNDSLVAEYKKLVPLKRFGKPSEVADSVLFLASDEAAYITGSVLDINGGI